MSLRITKCRIFLKNCFSKKLQKNRESVLILVIIIIAIIIFLKKFYSNQELFISNIENKSESRFDNNYKIVYFGDQRRISYTTIVTTLFLFEKSKHSSKEYNIWTNAMLKSLGVPIVAFVDYNWEKTFLERSKQNNLTGDY